MNVDGASCLKCKKEMRKHKGGLYWYCKVCGRKVLIKSSTTKFPVFGPPCVECGEITRSKGIGWFCYNCGRVTTKVKRSFTIEELTPKIREV